MATLTIRDLDEDVNSRLRIRASVSGRSIEAEPRAILRSALRPPRPNNLGMYLHELFADIGGVELEITRDQSPARVVDFSE